MLLIFARVKIYNKKREIRDVQREGEILDRVAREVIIKKEVGRGNSEYEGPKAKTSLVG